MLAHPVDEEHRASSPLELLFDLTFVVAIAQVAARSPTAQRRVTSPTRSGPTW